MSEKKRNEEEIDLLSYLEPAKKVLKFSGQLVQKIIRNIALFLIIAGVGILAAFFIRSRTPLYYTSEGLYLTRALPALYCTEMIGNLNKTIQESPAIASKMLNLNESAIRNIQSIAANPGDHITSSYPDSIYALFKVTLTVSDIAIIDSIESKIIPYLLNSQFAANQQAKKRNKIGHCLASAKSSLEQADSLSRATVRQLSGNESRNQFLTQPPLLKLTFFLQQYISGLNEEMNTPDIELFTPFIRKTQPDSSGLNKLFIKLVLASIVISILIVLALPPKRKV